MSHKKSLRMSSILLILSAMLFTGGALAWFYFPRKTNELFIFTAPPGLVCEVYTANDDNNNGIPDFSENDDVLNMSRTERLSVYYRTLEDAKKYNAENSDSSAFQNIFIGRRLSYKIVIKNSGNAKTDARIDVNFADMTAYFKTCVELLLNDETVSDEVLEEYFGDNSSRLLFYIRSRTATLYTDASSSGLFNAPTEPTLEFTDALPLWKHSQKERFFGSPDAIITVKHNTLLEIDFSLACDLIPDELNNYLQSAPDYYLPLIAQSGDPVPIAAAITQIAEKELLYVLNSDRPGATNNKLEFDIPQIIIRATQA